MNPAISCEFTRSHITFTSWKAGAAAAALMEHRLFAANEVDFDAMAAAHATLLSPFPGEGSPGVKVGVCPREAQ